MSDLSNNELRRLDLSLLLVFLGLIRHRKATDVAIELGLTQSAVSQALRRLRDIFGDELFLRRPHGMEPTGIAVALEAPIAQAVEQLRGALGAARSFVPAEATGVVRIAALDAEQAVLVPRLSAKLRSTAPALRVSVLPLGRRDALDALDENRVDLALGFIWDLPETIHSRELYEECFLVVGKPEVLPNAPRIDLDSYCATDHVLISPGGDLRGIVDEQLEAMGRSRKVILALPAFLPALAAVAASDAIVTLPSRVASTIAPGFGLVAASPPMEVRRFHVSVLWHKRNAVSPRSVWIRDLISMVAEELVADSNLSQERTNRQSHKFRKALDIEPP